MKARVRGEDGSTGHGRQPEPSSLLQKRKAASRPPQRAWLVLTVASLIVFGALGLARFGYGMVLPSMQAALGLTNTQTGLLATANLLGYMAMSAIAGAVASHYGSRIVVTIGLIVAAVGMVLTGAAGGVAALLMWRAVTGGASGCVNVPTVGLLPTWFPSRSGFAVGTAVAGQSLGLVAAGLLVPALVQGYGHQGWRVTWYVFAGVALALALLAFLFFYKPQGDQPHPEKETVRHSMRHVYRTRAMWHLGTTYTAYGFSYIIFMTYFTKRLVSDVGYTETHAGTLFMVMGWCSLLSGVLWGTLSDKLGRKPTLAIVYCTHCVAFTLFALWPSTIGVILATVLFGFTAWSVPVIMAAASSDVLGPRLCPAGLGFITMFFGIGQAVGPSVAGALADAAGGFAVAFMVAAAAALLGVVGSLTLRTAGSPGEACRIPLVDQTLD